MHFTKSTKAVLLALLLSPALAPIIATADTISDLDQYFQSLYPATEPGATIAITRDGEVIYRKAFGMADLENDLANQPEMVFRLGSITKQFSAVAIMMLEQEGKLKLSDSITMYLPNYTPPSTTITIEHLLTHTSGIPNYTSLPGWMESKIRMPLNDEEMMAGWMDLPLEFEPGSKWAYSNSAYYMLGPIIEKASGMPYDKFVEERIFKPLGMNHSYYDHSQRLIPNRSRGYDKNPEGGFLNTTYLDMGQPGAAGALASTVDDMAKWDAALYTDAILPQSVLERMWTSYNLTDGSKTGYGYGWAVGEHNGHRIISHGGGIPGFRTEGFRLPDEKIYVTVLSNGAANGPDVAATAAVKAMLEEPYNIATVELDAEALAPYVGIYQGDDSKPHPVTIENGKLALELAPGAKFPLNALGQHRFVVPNSTMEFEFVAEEGQITGLNMLRLGWEPDRYQRVQ